MEYTSERDTAKAVSALLVDEHQAEAIQARYSTRTAWLIPMIFGKLLVDVTVRPRWCSAAVDRRYTTARDPDVATAWFTEHVKPIVDDGARQRRAGNWFRVPTTPSITEVRAAPIDRAVFVDLLRAWIEQETWWIGDPATFRPARLEELRPGPPSWDPPR